LTDKEVADTQDSRRSSLSRSSSSESESKKDFPFFSCACAAQHNQRRERKEKSRVFSPTACQGCQMFWYMIPKREKYTK
jgi:hypothetical protein